LEYTLITNLFEICQVLSEANPMKEQVDLQRRQTQYPHHLILCTSTN